MGVKEETKFELSMIQTSVTFADAWNAPRIANLTSTPEGTQNTHKILLAILKLFQDSLHVTRGMDSAELFSCSHTLMKRYPAESLQDFILAFKRVKIKGTKFFNSFSEQDVNQIMIDYLEAKALFIETEHRLQFTDHEKGRNNKALTEKIDGDMNEIYSKFKERTKEPTTKTVPETAIELARQKARQLLSQPIAHRPWEQEEYEAEEELPEHETLQNHETDTKRSLKRTKPRVSNP